MPADLAMPPPKPRRQADVVLGEDWGIPTIDANNVEMPRPGHLHRRYTAKPTVKSTLARKIILMNFLALVVLIAGALYLDPFRSGLITQRERALVTEARLIADILRTSLPHDMPNSILRHDVSTLTPILDRIELNTGTHVYVYDPSGVLITSTLTATPVSDDPTGRRDGSVRLTTALDTIWQAMSNLLSEGSAPASAPVLEDLIDTLRHAALGGSPTPVVMHGVDGLGAFYATSAPIMVDHGPLGIVVVTTAADEINHLVQVEREKLLWMFLIALAVAVGLSLILASTIANPLSKLAAAAEVGRDKNLKHGTHSARVRIPDLSGRPDEIGRLSAAMRGMVAALHARIDANDQFAADVSHELKNPLASLRLAADTLKDVNTNDHRHRLLDIIAHDVRRLDRLISDISQASRLSNDLVKARERPFNLTNTLQNVANQHKAFFKEKGIEFIVDIPQAAIPISGLEDRLTQVFVNLLSNALSFCRADDTVRLWAHHNGPYIRIGVDDTGTGITTQSLVKIFDRFYSERPAEQFGNHSGLGLAISKQIVEAHGGSIWAENIHGTNTDPAGKPRGARFVVDLPL